MTLYLIGLGLENEKDITIKGLETINACSKIYLEGYTSLLQCSIADLEKLYGKKIIIANRNFSESGCDNLLHEAKDVDIAFLIIGDPLSATTHIEFITRAKELGVNLQIIHNASVLTAIGETGLQLYKFGATTSIPFLEDVPNLEAPYHRIRENHLLGTHTLCLLDLKPDQDKYMTIPHAIKIIQDIEKRVGEGVITNNMLVVGCSRLGTKTQLIKSGQLKEIVKIDFGPPPHCLIIPGKLHFVEKEMLDLWKI